MRLSASLSAPPLPAHAAAAVICPLRCRLLRLLSSLASHLDGDSEVEFHLLFIHALLLSHRRFVQSSLSAFAPLLRRVSRVLNRVKTEVGRVCEDNLYLLQLLCEKAAEKGDDREQDQTLKLEPTRRAGTHKADDLEIQEEAATDESEEQPAVAEPERAAGVITRRQQAAAEMEAAASAATTQSKKRKRRKAL